MKRVPAQQRSASLRYYYRQRPKRLARGLTVKGQVRRRVYKWPANVRASKQRKWNHDNAQRRRIRNRAAGLTERGTVPINRKFPELRGLASTNKSEYQRRQYLILKARRTRAGLAALVAGNNLVSKLK